jgi:predicted MFS family arabinose efflux permease
LDGTRRSGIVGAMSFVAAAWVRLAVPCGLANTAVVPKAWRSLAANPVILWLLLITVLQCAGQFSLFTYLAPAIAMNLRFDAREIGLLFGWFGVCGLIGNYVASRTIDRAGAGRVVGVSLALILAAFLIWPAASGSLALTMLAILIWGLGGLAIHPSQQARLVAAAPDLASASAAINLAATYLGQMIGSVLGGGLISWFGLNAISWGGVALIVAAAGATLVVRHIETSMPKACA